jgi:hypothetical protein
LTKPFPQLIAQLTFCFLVPSSTALPLVWLAGKFTYKYSHTGSLILANALSGPKVLFPKKQQSGQKQMSGEGSSLSECRAQDLLAWLCGIL